MPWPGDAVNAAFSPLANNSAGYIAVQENDLPIPHPVRSPGRFQSNTPNLARKEPEQPAWLAAGHPY